MPQQGRTDQPVSAITSIEMCKGPTSHSHSRQISLIRCAAGSRLSKALIVICAIKHSHYV